MADEKNSIDLTKAPSSQLTASPTALAIISFIVAPLLAILFTYLCNLLGIDQGLKLMIQTSLLGTGAGGVIIGGVGIVQRGLKLTDAKIANLTPQKLPENINAGGNVQVGPNTTPAAQTGQALTGLIADAPLIARSESFSNGPDVAAAIERAISGTAPVGVEVPAPTEWGSEVNDEA